MRSMTGFGVGSASNATGQVRVEIRALNHRYQDVRVRTSPELAELSFFVEQTARSKLGRGRYDISVRLEAASPGSSHGRRERIREAYRLLAELRDELAPGTELSISAALALPEALAPPATDDEAARQAILDAFREASTKLAAMRGQEGAALKQELLSRLDSLTSLRHSIKEGSDDLITHQQARLRSRVSRLLEDAQVSLNLDRLEHEVALLADKSDITEELVRLASHFDQLRALTDSSEPVGRRFDFLLQEVGREINTIGSKSQHAPIANLVVEMKAEVERLREQVQNVE